MSTKDKINWHLIPEVSWWMCSQTSAGMLCIRRNQHIHTLFDRSSVLSTSSSSLSPRLAITSTDAHTTHDCWHLCPCLPTTFKHDYLHNSVNEYSLSQHLTHEINYCLNFIASLILCNSNGNWKHFSVWWHIELMQLLYYAIGCSVMEHTWNFTRNVINIRYCSQYKEPCNILHNFLSNASQLIIQL